MTTISKEFHFCAAHLLLGLPETHPCSRLHGHNYVLRIFLRGEPDANGFVQDYRELDKIKNYVKNELDHQFLNDIFPNLNTTVENLSRAIFDKFKPDYPLMCAVEISETPKTNCRYEP